MVQLGYLCDFVIRRSSYVMAIRSQEHYEIAKRICPDAIRRAHGTVLVSPKQYMLDHIDAREYN